MIERTDKTPIFLSALVYPGAGQFLQRRWKAGLLFSLLFTLLFLLLLVSVIRPLIGSLDAAFQWAARQENRPFYSISVLRVVALFVSCVIVYIINLVDVTHSAGKKRTGSP